jgi:glycosyltransferase involved in cell wall biosynthesis
MPIDNMNVVSIGSDRKIFDAGSAVRARIIEYGRLFTELHVIIFTQAKSHYTPEKISDNVWIYPTNSLNRYWYPLSARHVYKKQLRKIKFDVITTQDPFESGLAGWLISRVAKTKLHIQIHTDFMSKFFTERSFLNYIRVWIARRMLPRATSIRAVSERIKNSLATIDPSLPAKTIVLPIYTDMQIFQSGPLTVDLHKKYPQFSFIILMASRLTHEKNLGLALTAFRDVVVKSKDVGLIIVGDGPEKHYVKGLVLRYHLDQNVVFEPWQHSIASYYRTADLFLTTSLYEGYGLTLVEAAAAGCPIISSNVGVAPYVIDNGVTGYICEVEDENNFAEKIRLLVEKPDIYREMKHAAERYATEKIYEPKSAYLAKYQAMLEAAAMAQ